MSSDLRNHHIALVNEWIARARAIQHQFGILNKTLPTSPESPFRTAIWDMFDTYTKALAELIGDTHPAADGGTWLEWFAWECDFGAKPMEMKFADGETLLVVGASDLLAAIQSDENGNRRWPEPSPAKPEEIAGEKPTRERLLRLLFAKEYRQESIETIRAIAAAEFDGSPDSLNS